MRRFTLGLCTLAALVPLSSPAGAQVTLIRQVIAGGGGFSSSGAAQAVTATIGQPVAGGMSGGSYELRGGFWHGLPAAAVPVPEPVAGTPEVIAFRLHPAFPNPAAGRTVLAYDLPTARSARMQLFDVTGRLVRTIADGPSPAGRNERVWDGTDGNGRRVAAGVYFVRMESGLDVARSRVVVLR